MPLGGPLTSAGAYEGWVPIADGLGGWAWGPITQQPESVARSVGGGLVWYDLRGSSPDSYRALGDGLSDGAVLSGNTGFARQSTGVPVKLAVQSRMRRCLLALTGASVTAYLDCDNSAKLAGDWLRIHEGISDPVTPTPGVSGTGNAWLRQGVPNWFTGPTYLPGMRVIHDGKLWEALVSTSAEPAVGSSDATLDGSAGMVMVEVPRFYVYQEHVEATGRHVWDVAFDAGEVAPYPNLAADNALLPTEKHINGRVYTVHPAFTLAGFQRTHRYYAAYRATATNTGDDGTGTLRSLPGDTSTRSISLTNFRTKARNMNTGLGASDPSAVANNVWHLVDFWLRDAVALLNLTEYRSHYDAGTLGAGRISGSDFDLVAGVAKSGNGSGVYDGSGDPVTPTINSSPFQVYRGIEHLWGGNWAWIDGTVVQFQNPAVLANWWLSNTPAQYADGSTTNYTQLGVSDLYATVDPSYVRAFSTNPVLAQAEGGSTTTYLTAGWYDGTLTASIFRALRVGSSADIGAAAGLRAVAISGAAAGTSSGIGGALAR